MMAVKRLTLELLEEIVVDLLHFGTSTKQSQQSLEAVIRKHDLQCLCWDLL